MMQITGAPAAVGKPALKAAWRTFVLFAAAARSLPRAGSGQQRSG